jgi:hypothetical protein
MKKSILIYQFLTVIIFLVIIVLPVFQEITHVFTLQKLEGENRATAKLPTFDLNRLDPFPSQFTAFYNDNFSFRALFFQFDYRIFFKKSPVKEVIIGRDSWLFLRTNSNLYQGITSFSETKIQLAVQNLEARKDNYEKMGVKFYIVIVPTSYEIYSEYLPRYIRRAETTRCDKFCELIRNTDIPFIYLKEDLLKNKTAGRLYRKNDHHWSELGAYFAYKAIIDLMKKDFPQIPIYSLTDFELTPRYSKHGNLIDMLNDNFKSILDEEIYYQVNLTDSSKRYYEVKKVGYPCVEGFSYPDEYEQDAETPLKDLPNIVIIRDSYFNAMMPFFYNSFSRSVAIWDAWRYQDNMDIVSHEKAKIVLLILTEANIHNLF